MIVEGLLTTLDKDGTPHVAPMGPAVDASLTARQRAAVRAALDLGYYDVPREADHEAVADAIDCAPSTAAEHLRKAEATLLRGAMAQE